MQDNTKYKPLTILIPTYNRPETLVATVRKLNAHLRYRGRISILIGNDGDPFELDDLPITLRAPNVTILEGPRRGHGANLNMLLRASKSDLVLQLDHDHWLQKDLVVNDYAEDLYNDELNVGWIRLFMGERQDYSKPNKYYKFKAATFGPYWYIDAGSPFLYIASHRPHIKRVSFHAEYFGWYPENKKLGVTEEAWCHQYKDRRQHTMWGKAPWVVVPMLGLIYDQWMHEGVSSSLQKEGL